MIRVILHGACGHMGQVVRSILADDPDVAIAAGIDANPKEAPFPVYRSFGEVAEDADVLIDASHHSTTPELLEYAEAHSTPAVICTTGHTEAELSLIKRASERIPILKSRNMSVGINVLLDLVKRAAASLGDGYDGEIVEAHHNSKLDAPSGTALMLADAVKEVREDAEYIYDRHGVRRPRGKDEIGIHSIRGGTVVGEHEVRFLGTDEELSILHRATSKRVFATGAIKAASFLTEQPNGLYSMDDLVAKITE